MGNLSSRQSITSNKLQLFEELDHNENSLSTPRKNSTLPERKSRGESISEQNLDEIFQKQSHMKLNRQGSKRSIRNTIMNFGRFISGSRQRASTMSCQKF